MIDGDLLNLNGYYTLFLGVRKMVIETIDGDLLNLNGYKKVSTYDFDDGERHYYEILAYLADNGDRMLLYDSQCKAETDAAFDDFCSALGRDDTFYSFVA